MRLEEVAGRALNDAPGTREFVRPTAMAPVSKNFGPQNCGAVPRMSVEDQGAARMIEDYYDFPAATWLLAGPSGHSRLVPLFR